MLAFSSTRLLTPGLPQHKIPAAVPRAGRAGQVPIVPRPQLSFTLRNERSEIARMFSLLERYCQDNRIAEDDLFNVRLVLDEALINVIVHGYDDEGGHQIHVSLRLEAGVLNIRIDDDAAPYNPLDAPAPRFDLPIEHRRIGGLGVHIMKTLARSVEYRRADGRNVLTITMTVGEEGGTVSRA